MDAPDKIMVREEVSSMNHGIQAACAAAYNGNATVSFSAFPELQTVFHASLREVARPTQMCHAHL